MQAKGLEPINWRAGVLEAILAFPHDAVVVEGARELQSNRSYGAPR